MHGGTVEQDQGSGQALTTEPRLGGTSTSGLGLNSKWTSQRQYRVTRQGRVPRLYREHEDSSLTTTSPRKYEKQEREYIRLLS